MQPNNVIISSVLSFLSVPKTIQIHTYMGVRRLFSRGRQNFQEGGPGGKNIKKTSIESKVSDSTKRLGECKTRCTGQSEGLQTVAEGVEEVLPARICIKGVAILS